MVLTDYLQKGSGMTPPTDAEPAQAFPSHRALVPIFPRSDLTPDLFPFERTVRHVADLFPQVEALLEEDLADLSGALLACLPHTQSEEEQTKVQQAITLVKQAESDLRRQLAPLLTEILSPFIETPEQRELRLQSLLSPMDAASQ